MANQLKPMIYVACLAAYNAGMLHGKWIEAEQSTDDLQAEVFEMLHQSPISDAEEWAIHDYLGFGDLSLSEYTGMAEVSELAALTAQHGRPFTAYAAYVGSEYATEDRFEDAYCGEHGDRTDFARDLFDEIYPDLPAGLRSYIDHELFARDLFLGDYLELSSPTGIYVFQNV